MKHREAFVQTDLLRLAHLVRRIVAVPKTEVALPKRKAARQKSTRRGANSHKRR
jgi:hypothetical protein